MKPIVRLEKYELEYAAIVGIRRHIEKCDVQTRFSDRGNPSLWGRHISAACAEMAAAKFFGIYWDGSINTFKLPDLSYKIEVRSTRSDKKELIVRKGDSTDLTYVCMYVMPDSYSRFTLLGFMSGKEAMQDKYWKIPPEDDNRPPAFFVPETDLWDCTELKERMFPRNRRALS